MLKALTENQIIPEVTEGESTIAKLDTYGFRDLSVKRVRPVVLFGCDDWDIANSAGGEEECQMRQRLVANKIGRGKKRNETTWETLKSLRVVSFRNRKERTLS